MLTECFVLSRALEEAGIPLEAQHPSIKVPGISTGPVIRVCLDRQGTVVRCEQVVKENLAGLWVHRKGNHKYFPVIRLAQPLMAVPAAEQTSRVEEPKGKGGTKASAGERRKALMEKLSRAEPRQFTKETVDLFVGLRDEACRLAQTLEGHNEAIVRVCHAYNLAIPVEAKKDNTLQPVPLLEALREKAKQWLAVCDDLELDALEVLLFTAGGKGGKKAQLALDVDDLTSTIYRSEVRKTAARAFLQKGEAREQTSQPQHVDCAFAGKGDVWTDPFPMVRLPVLGREFYIFSMNSEAECNQRYGLKGSSIVPVAQDLVLRMQDALREIVREERRGKTWRSIAGEKSGTYDLLIAYVDGQPEIPVAVADFLGRSGNAQQGQFDADASAVCEALDGIKRQRPGSRLNLFIVRKASEGQAFVALAETPTVEEVLKGAEWWQSAARNVPLGSPVDEYVIFLPILNEEKRLERRKPWVPHPGEVSALLTQAWMNKRGGSADETRVRTNKLRGTTFGEVLDMMLQRPGKAETAAKHILSLCLNHAGPLLRGLGGAQQEDWKAYGDKERLIALRAVSTIGMTLYALGSKKEDYVNKAAFQIGQVLALADRLHWCYCLVVRDGAMPPNLIGNAVFDAALNSPDKALATLAERIRVYLAWAETIKTEPIKNEDEKEKEEQKKKPKQKDIAAAREEATKILRLFKPLTAKLHEQGLPERCDDVTKAHLLLGYLAGEEGEAKAEGVNE